MKLVSALPLRNLAASQHVLGARAPRGTAPSGTLDKRVRQRPRAFRRWGPTTMIGPDLRLQARPGRRAAVMELRPGLYLLGDLNEEELKRYTERKTEVGFLPALAPLLITAATVALKPGEDGRPAAAHMADDIAQLFKRSRSVDDLEPELGCAGDRCRCRGGR